MKPLAFVLALMLATAPALVAQAPVPAPPAAAAAPAADLPSPPADYTYATGGRRDPFMSLAGPRGPILETQVGVPPPGVRGITVDELSVKGIVLSNGSYVAMVSGAGGKNQTYTVKAGGQLRDGVVQSITADAIVIVQQVTDPLSPQKQRTVRKPLRTQEEGK